MPWETKAVQKRNLSYVRMNEWALVPKSEAGSRRKKKTNNGSVVRADFGNERVSPKYDRARGREIQTLGKKGLWVVPLGRRIGQGVLERGRLMHTELTLIEL